MYTGIIPMYIKEPYSSSPLTGFHDERSRQNTLNKCVNRCVLAVLNHYREHETK